MQAGKTYYVGGPHDNYFLYDRNYSSTEFNQDLMNAFIPVNTVSDKSVTGLGTVPCMSGGSYVYVINGLFNACAYVGYAESSSYIKFKANEWFFINDTQAVTQTDKIQWTKAYNFYCGFDNWTWL